MYVRMYVCMTTSIGFTVEVYKVYVVVYISHCPAHSMLQRRWNIGQASATVWQRNYTRHQECTSSNTRLIGNDALLMTTFMSWRKPSVVA